MTMIVTPIIIPVRSEPSWCEKHNCKCPCHSEPSRDWFSALLALIAIGVPLAVVYLQFTQNIMGRGYQDEMDMRVGDAIIAGLFTFVVLVVGGAVLGALGWALSTIYRSIFK
jgi:hypothetical protein